MMRIDAVKDLAMGLGGRRFQLAVPRQTPETDTSKCTEFSKLSVIPQFNALRSIFAILDVF